LVIASTGLSRRVELRLISRMRGCIASVISAILVVTSSARAEPPARGERKWYGSHTLIADGSSLVTLVVPPLGIGGYLFATPIVHWAHGNVGTGFASLGVRILAPAVGAVGGCAAGGCEGRGNYSGAAVGLAIGCLGAIALDAFVFAYEEEPSASVPRVQWRPTLGATPTSGSIGLSASF
jgi:hypothetical protein